MVTRLRRQENPGGRKALPLHGQGQPRHCTLREYYQFQPYSTDEEVPIIGKCKATLKNKGGWKHETTIYVVDGGEESLLGKEDALALGIIHLDKVGKRAPGADPKRNRRRDGENCEGI